MNSTPQLYDLNADPSEQNNVLDEHPDVVEQLSRLLNSQRGDGRSRANIPGSDNHNDPSAKSIFRKTDR